jgi:hypothetical protein
VPRLVLRAVAVLVAAALLLHGAQDEIQFALLLAGAIHVEARVSRAQILTQLLLWGPWFLLGGALFSAAAVSLRPPRPGRPRATR